MQLKADLVTEVNTDHMDHMKMLRNFLEHF